MGFLIDYASEAGEGDGDVADLLQVTEEAEQVQAERIMEGDDMQMHIHSALKRMEARERKVLAYVSKEDDEEEEKGKVDDDEGWEVSLCFRAC